MASVNRIDSVYDVAAIAAEQEAVEKLVRASIEQIKAARSQSIDFNVNTKTIADYNAKVTELNTSLTNMKNTVAATTAATTANTQATQQANGTLQQNIELRRRLQTTLNSYLKDQKEDIALLKSGTITRAEYNKRLTESQVKIAVYKQKIQELNRVVKEDIALEGKAGDAYKQLSAEYNRAALAAKNYQITLGKNHPTTIQAVANAKRLSTQLKDVDNAVGQNTRNVGNYGSALNKFLTPLRTAANILPGLGMSGIILGIGVAVQKLISALMGMNKEFDRSAVAKKHFEEATKQSISTSAKELVSVDSLVAAARNENLTREQRNLAVKQLQDQYPSYLKNITLETINSQEATTAINELKEAILQKSIAEAYAGKISEVVIKQAELRRKIDKEEIKDLNDAIAFRNKLATARQKGDKAAESALLRYGRLTDITQKNLHTYNKELDQTNQELEDLEKAYNNAVAGSLKLTTAVDKEAKQRKGPKQRDLAEADRKARFEILKAQIELDKEFDLIRANDEKRTFVDRLSNLINYGADSQRLIEAQAKFDLLTAGKTSTERQKIELDKNNALIRLATELNDRLKKITADSFETGTNKLPIDPKIPKELQKILDDFDKAQKKAIKDAADNAKKLKDALKDAFQSLASELQGLFFDIFTNQIEQQKNAVQDQIDLLEQQKQKDIEVANQTITNAQDKADAIAVIEARAAGKRQQLELKQRQLDQQKARFEKARTIAEIVQSTSLAVVNALTQVKTLGPGAIALAAVIGAIGAIQIARAIAQPIPRYAEGTENHPGGLAIVGDGGKSETVVLPDGSLYRTPSKDTLIDLPKGSQVIPDYIGRPQNITIPQPVDNRDELRQGFASVVYAVKRIPQPIIKADRAWTQAHKTGSSYRNYLNRSI